MQEDSYVMRGQKMMRRGYTTGTCAAACARAAVLTLLTGRISSSVSVLLPGGGRAVLSVDLSSDSSGSALCAKYRCRKDAGDDPDVTNGCSICVEARYIQREDVPEHAFSDERYPGLFLTGGKGVGTVTKPGLAQAVGEAAINRVPRQMIFREAASVMEEEEMTWTVDAIPSDGSGEGAREGTVPSLAAVLLTVSVPGGEEIARKTFNSNLGIAGGISILGTSGIVEPMSEKALLDTIRLECRQAIAMGERNLLFVPGNYGEKYVREDLGVTDRRVIQCSNYIGDAVDIAKVLGATSILFVGNFGKMVKVAAGIMNTHSHIADARWEIVTAHAALCEVAPEKLKEIRQALTTDQMLDILGDDRQKVVNSILERIGWHLGRRAGDMPVGALVFSEKYGYLGETEGAGLLLGDRQQAGLAGTDIGNKRQP